MKRFHVHVSVNDLTASIRFYRALFAAEPAVIRHDYAKWMLEDPRVNFAISTHRQSVGVNHLGFQVESDQELRGMRAQLEAADAGLWKGTSRSVATRNRISTGSPIPPELRGRRSIRWNRHSLPVAAQNERRADL